MSISSPASTSGSSGPARPSGPPTPVGPAPASGATTADTGSRWRALTGSATPGRLRRRMALLVLGCVLTAILSAVAGTDRTDATGDAGARLSALDFDASELYESLNGANASAATGFGADRAGSPTMLARYDSYVTGAYLRLQHAQGLLGQLGSAGSTDSTDTVTADQAAAESIGYGLPRYTADVDAARALRDQGSPRASAQLGSAFELMNSTILPAAERLQRDRGAALAANDTQAAGFPYLVVLLAVVTLVGMIVVSVWEARRTKRLFNVGLAVASVAMAVVVAWWLAATAGAAGRLDDAVARGTVASQLGQARVLLLQARAAETSAVASGGPTGALPATLAAKFGPVTGPGGLLDAAATGAGAPSAEVAAIRTATNDWQQALASQGPGSDGSRVTFVRLTSALDTGTSGEQGQRTAAVEAASEAFTGLAVVPAILALVAAAAVAVGLGRRLREYR